MPYASRLAPLAALSGLLVTSVLGAQSPRRRVPTPPPQPPPQQIRMAASSFATVEVHINSRPIGGRWYDEDAALTGPARIAIAYGQPHARGRRVEGGLIPLDTVWRFGANRATTLHTDVDIVLGENARGGLRVPRGDYTLFVRYGRRGYELIVNRQTGQWGTDYDRTADFGRVPLAARRLAEPEEALTIYLEPRSDHPTTGYAELGGILRIKWGLTELSAPWRVIP